MIGRKRAIARRERGTAAGSELIGVEFDRESQPLRSLEEARDLLRRERNRLAEGIDRVGQAFARDCGQDIVADERDVGVGILPFRRQRVQAEVESCECELGAVRSSPRATRNVRSSVSRSRP